MVSTSRILLIMDNNTCDVQLARSVNHYSKNHILNQIKAYESASSETIKSIIKQVIHGYEPVCHPQKAPLKCVSD